MTEKHLILEEADPVIFYGVNNANMQMIKALYPKLRIVARGNVIKVMVVAAIVFASVFMKFGGVL